MTLLTNKQRKKLQLTYCCQRKSCESQLPLKERQRKMVPLPKKKKLQKKKAVSKKAASVEEKAAEEMSAAADKAAKEVAAAVE